MTLTGLYTNQIKLFLDFYSNQMDDFSVFIHYQI